MNRHLLHPALLHRLLQRMARNLHFDTMRANGLDVILVLPGNQRENLEGKDRRSPEASEVMAVTTKQMRAHTIPGFTSPSSSSVVSGPVMLALLMALLMVWVSNCGHAACAFPSLSLFPFSQ